MSDEEAEEALANLGDTPEEEQEVIPEEQEEEIEVKESSEPEQPEEEVEEEPEEELDGAEEPEPTETSDEDSETLEEEPTEVEEASQFSFEGMPKDMVLPYKIPVNGMEVNVTVAELEEGFKKGMNYTQKMQELAPMRKTVGMIKENDISTQDLDLLIEVKKGNKEAIAKLIADSNVDPLDIETENAKEYVPQNHEVEVEDFQMQEVKDVINADTEFVDATKSALNVIPDDLYNMVSSNPQALQALHTDVRNGVFAEVYPEVMKLKALGRSNEPTINLYQEVVNKIAISRQNEQEVNTSKEKIDDIKSKQDLATKRNNAARSKGKPSAKKSFVDYNDLDDDDYAKEYEKIMGRKMGED